LGCPCERPAGKPAGHPQLHPPCLVRREPGGGPWNGPESASRFSHNTGFRFTASGKPGPAPRIDPPTRGLRVWHDGEVRTAGPANWSDSLNTQARSRCPANRTSNRSSGPPPDTPKCPGARHPLVPCPSHSIAEAISPLESQPSEKLRRSASLIELARLQSLLYRGLSDRGFCARE